MAKGGPPAVIADADTGTSLSRSRGRLLTATAYRQRLPQ